VLLLSDALPASEACREVLRIARVAATELYPF